MSSIIHPIERKLFLKNGIDQLRQANADKQKIFFDSHYQFWNVINGPRPGTLHLIVGAAGSGKSTLLLSNILLWARKYKILLILSEEMVVPYLCSIVDIKSDLKLDDFAEDHFYLDKRKLPTNEEIVNNILPLAELDCQENMANPDAFEKTIKGAVDAHNPDIIVYDNFSTGVYSEYDLSRERRGAHFFGKLARDTNKPVIVAQHTSKKAPTINRIVGMNDSEGSNHLIKRAEFLTTFSKFVIQKRIFQILTIHKYRGFSGDAMKHNYQFVYQKYKAAGIFLNDIPKSKEQISELVKHANSL